MVKENSNGLIKAPSKVILMKIILKALVNTNGQTEEFITVNGPTTKWRDTVLSHGLTAENTLVNTKTIKNTDKDHLNGQMVASI